MINGESFKSNRQIVVLARRFNDTTSAVESAAAVQVTVWVISGNSKLRSDDLCSALIYKIKLERYCV